MSHKTCCTTNPAAFRDNSSSWAECNSFMLNPYHPSFSIDLVSHFEKLLNSAVQVIKLCSFYHYHWILRLYIANFLWEINNITQPNKMILLPEGTLLSFSPHKVPFSLSGVRILLPLTYYILLVVQNTSLGPS